MQKTLLFFLVCMISNRLFGMDVFNALLKIQLVKAVKDGNNLEARILIQTGVDTDDIDIDELTHGTPLYRAIFLKRESIALMLMKSGANINKAGYVTRTPLCEATLTMNNPILTKILLELRADTDKQDIKRQTLLHRLVQLRKDTLIKKFIQYNAPQDIEDKDGKTADSYALTDEIKKLFNAHKCKRKKKSSFAKASADRKKKKKTKSK